MTTPCSREEADSLIFVHAKSIAEEGNKSLMIKANDTDVVVIVMSVMLSLKKIALEYLWIACGPVMAREITDAGFQFISLSKT